MFLSPFTDEERRQRKLATCTAVDLMVTYRRSSALSLRAAVNWHPAVRRNRRLFLAEGSLSLGRGADANKQTSRPLYHLCVSIHQLPSSRSVERMARILAAADMATCSHSLYHPSADIVTQSTALSRKLPGDNLSAGQHTAKQEKIPCIGFNQRNT